MTSFQEELKLAQTRLERLNLQHQAYERKLQDFQFTCGISISLSAAAIFFAGLAAWSLL